MPRPPHRSPVAQNASSAGFPARTRPCTSPTGADMAIPPGTDSPMGRGRMSQPVTSARNISIVGSAPGIKPRKPAHRAASAVTTDEVGATRLLPAVRTADLDGHFIAVGGEPYERAPAPDRHAQLGDPLPRHGFRARLRDVPDAPRRRATRNRPEDPRSARRCW